jgi:hypothetical protein
MSRSLALPWRAACLGCIVIAIGATTASLVRANGQEFFDPGADTRIDLVYVGRVRDVNGRFLKGAEVVIWSPDAGMTFPALSDAYGHYQSPDVGASLKGAAAAVDPKLLKVECVLPGYEQVGPTRIPRKTHGRVEMDFIMRSARASTPAPERRQAHGILWAVPGLLVLVVIGAAVHRSRPPRIT